MPAFPYYVYMSVKMDKSCFSNNVWSCRFLVHSAFPRERSVGAYLGPSQMEPTLRPGYPRIHPEMEWLHSLGILCVQAPCLRFFFCVFL